MALPKYNELYPDVLAVLQDSREHALSEIRQFIIARRGLSPVDLEELLSSGQRTFPNRVRWSCQFLKQAGLIQATQRGIYQITAVGSAALSSGAVIDNAFLMRYPSFSAFVGKKKDAPPSVTDLPSPPASTSPAEESATPQDNIDAAISEINSALAEELMQEILGKDAAFFERLVVKLLLKMGYSRVNRGTVTPLRHDGGIDGIISEDRLGLNQIYFQAKRWDPSHPVSRPEIQKFSGALRDVGASNGIFITTAHFSKDAVTSANRQHIVLVDGQRLTQLMIEYQLGVSAVSTYTICQVDSDFFNEDE